MESAGQIEAAVEVARRHLHDGLIAACLYGSATEGGLRRFSDLDLLFLVAEWPEEAVRRRLALGWLALSGPPGPARRPLEVTVLARPDVRPWRHPAWRVLQVGEWLRADMEAGIIEPPRPDPDLAVLLTQARRSGRALAGPPPADCYEPVPAADLRSAIAESLPGLLGDWREDARNVLLTLARMWLTAATGEIAPKDEAAAWAIARLGPADAAWLGAARDEYLGTGEVDWTAAGAEFRPAVDALARRVEAALGR